MTISNHTAIPLSRLFRDPVLVNAFARAERDDGAAFVMSAPRLPKLTGGAARAIEFTPSVREALEFLADAAIMLLDEIDQHGDELEDDDREEVSEDEGVPEEDACLGWREWTGRGEHVGAREYALA